MEQLMRILLTVLLLTFLTQAYAENSKAIIIDSRVFIKYSSVKYKDLNYSRDRKTQRYYYANTKELELYNALSNLKNVDLFIADSYIGKRITSTLKKLGFDLSKIKDVIKVKKQKIDLEDFNNYSQTLVLDYSKLFKSNFKRFDIGSNIRFFKSTDDAKKALSKLSKKNRKSYSSLYPTTQRQFDAQIEQDRNLMKVAFNFSEDLLLSTASPINKESLIELISNGYRAKWNIENQVVLSEKLNVITSCGFIDSISGNEFIVDNFFCEKKSQGSKYIVVSDDGYVTGKSCFLSKDNSIFENVDISYCQQVPRTYKWKIENNTVQSCDIVTTDKNLIINESDDFTDCHNTLGSHYTWKVTANKVLGCNLSTLESNATISSEDNLDKCSNNLGTQLHWTFNSNKTAIKGCRETTTDSSVLIQNYATKKCLEFPKLKSLTKVNLKHNNSNIITGCMLSTTSENAFIIDLTESQCTKNLSIKHAWIYSSDKTKVTGCRKYDSNTNLTFPNTKLEECIDTLKVDYYWEHKNKKVISCMEVTHSAPNKPIRTMPTFIRCENNSGVKYNFDKVAGKVTSCTKRSNWRNLLISTTSDLSACLGNLPGQVESRIIYNKTKSQIKSCGTKLVSGEALPDMYNGTCSFKKALLRSDTNDFIKGCFEINPNDGRGINKLPITDCILNNSTYEYDYLYSTTEDKVKGCYVIDSNSKLPVLDLKVALDNCRDQTKSSYAWKGLRMNTCLEFVLNKNNDTYYKIASASSKHCHQNFHVIYNKAISSYQVVEGRSIDPSATYSENVIATQTEMHELAKEHISIYKKFIIKTNRNVTTYNYRARKLVKGNGLTIKSTGKINTHSKIAIDYANEWMDAIRNFLPNETGMLGWGLYTASNPVESKKYGGSNWAMVAIDLPEGSNFLDIRSVPKGYIPVTRRAWEIQTAKCGRPAKYKYPIPSDKIYAAIHKNYLTKCRIGHQAFTKALKALEINAIVYDWDYRDNFLSNQRPKVCDTSITNATFVIVETPLNSSTVKLMVPQGTPSPTAQELQWHTYVNKLTEEFSNVAISSTNDPTIDPMTNKGYLDWKSKNQFACKREHIDIDKVKK
jgi:hypothetical protein